MLATPGDVRHRMAEIFEWKTSPETGSRYFNLFTWWREPDVIAGIGNLLAEPFRAAAPTVVIGPSASGYLTGVLAAASLGVGFCPIPKDAAPSFDSDPWITVTSPPDYKDRHLELGLPKGLIRSGDRVLAVDDLIDTGGQLLALQRLVGEMGATWIGASVLIDNLKENQPRRQLNLKSVFHIRDL
ncbi:phosphoribosyltransferase family protein [Arthrobacter sp. U41]|uniref:phosphoribosyltransferase family protein n=1 Tax=Arthrobacter sp. U41 TaxID=1849032 RepID=UPI0011A24830|nr:phosphoribosyltransferase family protein [Arthrobacter sp. U41]